MYNIVVKVNETSRPNFVQTMLFDNSTEIINQAGASIPQAGKTSSAGKSGKTKVK